MREISGIKMCIKQHCERENRKSSSGVHGQAVQLSAL